MLRFLLSWCVVLGLSAMWPTAAEAVNFPDCGGENQRTCKWTDQEYYDNGSQACEYDLKASGGVCVNELRRVWTQRSAWLTWAVRQQRYGVEGNEPVNLITTISAHNAFSSLNQGFGTDQANQKFSITDLLRMGARALELDPHWSVSKLRLCHWGPNEACPQAWTRLLASSFDEIRNWLDANPDEVIFIKLDDKIAGRNDELIAMVTHYFGNKLYPRASDAGAWPTPLQVRAAGKQVLLAMRNTNVATGNYFWYFNNGYATGNDWPKDIDFNTCVDGDGRVIHKRPRWMWSATAEGRSSSNPFSPTGLIAPATTGMKKLLACGVSLIGLDFLDALDTAIYYPDTAADDRIESSIWSYEKNDYGSAGPALMRATTGRWTSRAPTEVHRFACSIPDTGNVWGRVLRATTRADIWSRGNDACVQEYGASARFSFPSSSFLNDQLFQRSGGADLWLNYTLVPQADPLVQPGRVNFRSAIAQPAGTAEITVYGRPALGQNLLSKSDQSWVTITPLDGPVPLEQGNRFHITVDHTAVPRVAQINRASLTFYYEQLQQPVTVPLEYAVLREAAVSLGYANGQVRQPTAATAIVTLTSPQSTLLLTGGTVTVREAVPGVAGADTTFRTLGSAGLSGAGAQLTVNVPMSSVTLGAGPHTLFAEYTGGTNHANSTSAGAPLTVLPRIEVQPTEVKFSMSSGGPLPAPQKLKMAGFTGTPFIDKLPTWATATTVDGEPAVALKSNALQFSAGTFSGSFIVGDGTGVDTDVPIRVNVALPTGQLPTLYATTRGVRRNGAVPLRIVNAGRGVAAAAELAAVSSIQVVAGSGTVRLPGTVPIPLGSLQPGAGFDVVLPLEWPATASRIRLTLQFTSNSGAYVGTQTLNLVR